MYIEFSNFRKIFNHNWIGNYVPACACACACPCLRECLPHMFVQFVQRPRARNPKIAHKSRATAVCGNKRERDFSRALPQCDYFFVGIFSYLFFLLCWQFAVLRRWLEQTRRSQIPRLAKQLLIEKRDADANFLSSPDSQSLVQSFLNCTPSLSLSSAQLSSASSSSLNAFSALCVKFVGKIISVNLSAFWFMLFN